jgi:hypothetical protein
VFLAASEDDPRHQVAVKQLYSREEKGAISQKIQREITALESVTDENIIRLLGVDVQVKAALYAWDGDLAIADC